MGFGRARVLIVGVLCAGGCRERNPAFMPDAVLTTSEGSSTGMVATSEESSTGSASTTFTTSASTTFTTSTSSESSSESTSDGGTVPYASCNDQACPPGWDDCIELDSPQRSWCTHFCDVPEDCEAPLTGDAEVVCAGPSGDQCALDCSDGQTCPDGMSCVEIFGSIVRCVWEA